jgi:thymidine kinase
MNTVSQNTTFKINEQRLFDNINNFIKTPNTNKIELVLCIGPMFSGKTTLLHNTYFNILNNNNIPYLIINHINDTRNTSQFLSSHNNDVNGKVSCLKLNCLFDKTIDQFIQTNDKMIILIDESQFFNDIDQFIFNCFNIKDKNIFILCFGINSNFRRENIGKINLLLPYASNIIILSGKCTKCGDYSYCSYYNLHETSDKNTDIIVGGSDKYIPLCHTCFTNTL